MTKDFEDVIKSAFSDSQLDEFKTIMTLGTVTQTSFWPGQWPSLQMTGAVDLLRGHLLDENGIPS